MPGGQPIQGHLIGIAGQIAGGFERGQGVQVDNAVNAVIIILQGHIILDRAQVIAQVLAPGWPRAGKNPSFFH